MTQKDFANIRYIENNQIAVDTLTQLYKSVGWLGYTDHPEKMRQILLGSLFYISAWEDDELVGLIRTIGDGCSILYIQDILVHPAHQRKGIGRTLIERTLKKAEGIRQIVLITDDTEKTKAFYKSVGMKPIEETQGVAFVKYNFET